MSKRCLLESVAAARAEFSITVADTPSLVAEAFRVRHQVYCIEREFESGMNGLESDDFDDQAQHVLLRHRASQAIVGTVRVVMPNASALSASFPMQRVCQSGVLSSLPLRSTGEISRFALSKDRRADAGSAAVFMRLGLMQGIVRVSRDAGLTHWCAIMERSLLRLLQSTGIHFRAIGPVVEHHGIRQPAFGSIDEVMDRMWAEARPVWDYLTADGALWPAPAAQRLAA